MIRDGAMCEVTIGIPEGNRWKGWKVPTKVESLVSGVEEGYVSVPFPCSSRKARERAGDLWWGRYETDVLFVPAGD